MSGMTDKETKDLIAWRNREMNRMNDEIRRLGEQLELKESEYQATIDKANVANKLAREYQSENQRLREENERLELDRNDWKDQAEKEHRMFLESDKEHLETNKLLRDASKQVVRLQKELQGIGAEQYFTLQAENRELRKEVRRLKKIDERECLITVDLRKQNAELVGVLDFYANRQAYYLTKEYQAEVLEDYGSKAREVLRKYGLEGEADA